MLGAVREADLVEQLERAARGARPTRRRAPISGTSTFIRAVSSLSSRCCWKTNPTSSRRARSTGMPSASAAPSSRMRPLGRLVEPADQVQQRALPRSRAPADRDELARLDVQRDVAERLDRAEAPADPLDVDARPAGGARTRRRRRAADLGHRVPIVARPTVRRRHRRVNAPAPPTRDGRRAARPPPRRRPARSRDTSGRRRRGRSASSRQTTSSASRPIIATESGGPTGTATTIRAAPRARSARTATRSVRPVAIPSSTTMTVRPSTASGGRPAR